MADMESTKDRAMADLTEAEMANERAKTQRARDMVGTSIDEYLTANPPSQVRRRILNVETRNGQEPFITSASKPRSCDGRVSKVANELLESSQPGITIPVMTYWLYTEMSNEARPITVREVWLYRLNAASGSWDVDLSAQRAVEAVTACELCGHDVEFSSQHILEGRRIIPFTHVCTRG